MVKMPETGDLDHFDVKIIEALSEKDEYPFWNCHVAWGFRKHPVKQG